MMDKNGYNPMRWDCERRGCFNRLMRPKIEVFAKCFPGRINFSDIDGIVELKGNALLLEWKSHTGELPTGQRIMYNRLTKGGTVTVFIVCGNAETMETTHIMVYWKGESKGWEPATLEEVRERMEKWAKWATQ